MTIFLGHVFRCFSRTWLSLMYCSIIFWQCLFEFFSEAFGILRQLIFCFETMCVFYTKLGQCCVIHSSVSRQFQPDSIPSHKSELSQYLQRRDTWVGGSGQCVGMRACMLRVARLALWLGSDVHTANQAVTLTTCQLSFFFFLTHEKRNLLLFIKYCFCLTASHSATPFSSLHY